MKGNAVGVNGEDEPLGSEPEERRREIGAGGDSPPGGASPGAATSEDPAGVVRDDGAGAPQAGAVGVEGSTFFEHLPQFVIFPLLVVTVAVLIIVFFRASVEDTRPVSEILGEIQQSWRKSPSAFALAMRARQERERGRRFSPGETRQLVRIIEETEDSNLRTFLIEALGFAGDEEIARAALLDVLERAATSGDERELVNTIRGLGLSRSADAVEPLVREMARAKAPERWEVRLNVLLALASIASALDPAVDGARIDRVRGCFREALRDESWTVSWNAAIALATEFHDAAGLETLENLLSREYLSRRVEGSDDQAVWLQRAVEALAELDGDALRSSVKALEDDPSMKVRNAVFQYLKRKRPASG